MEDRHVNFKIISNFAVFGGKRTSRSLIKIGHSTLVRPWRDIRSTKTLFKTDTSPTRYQTTKIILLLDFFLTKSTLANRCMGDTFSMPRPKRSTTPSPAPPSPSPSTSTSTSASSTASSRERTTRRRRSEVSDEERDQAGPSKKAVTTQQGTSAESFYGTGRSKVCAHAKWN